MRLQTSKFLLVALAALTVAGIKYAAAEEPIQCFSKEQLVQTMIGEGQISVAGADEPEELPGTGLRRDWGWIFTTNNDGSIGYAIRANAASGQYNQACIMHKLHNVVLVNDTTAMAVPPALLLPAEASRGAMTILCNEEKQDTLCGPHNEILERMNEKGERVLYFGTNTEGEFVTLVGIGNADRTGGLAETAMSTGTLALRHLFNGVGYTARGIKLLNASH